MAHRGKKKTEQLPSARTLFSRSKIVAGEALRSMQSSRLPVWTNEKLPMMAEIAEKWFDKDRKENVYIGTSGGQIALKGKYFF